MCLFNFFLKVVSSPADVAEKADRIITMLPTSNNAIEAYSGANGILKYVFLNCGYFLVLIVHAFPIVRPIKKLQWCLLKLSILFSYFLEVNGVVSLSL